MSIFFPLYFINSLYYQKSPPILWFQLTKYACWIQFSGNKQMSIWLIHLSKLNKKNFCTQNKPNHSEANRNNKNIITKQILLIIINGWLLTIPESMVVKRCVLMLWFVLNRSLKIVRRHGSNGTNKFHMTKTVS